MFCLINRLVALLKHLASPGAHGHLRTDICCRFRWHRRHPGRLARRTLGPAGMAVGRLLLRLQLFVGRHNHYPLGHALHSRAQTPL